jgi:hypothetical protein
MRQKFKPGCLPVVKNVVNANENISQQLTRFGDSQLAPLSPRNICQSTAHLILATAFFSGAAIGLAKNCHASKQDYLAALQQFLCDRFGLSSANAKGMIESNARLYKKYKLIENIYHSGWCSAQEWSQQPDTTGNTLAELLSKHHDLSMSQLHIEGTKEERAPTPVEVEEIIPVEATPVQEVVQKPWRQRVLWLVFIAVVAGIIYLGLYPQYIPPIVKTLATQLWQSAQHSLSSLR